MNSPDYTHDSQPILCWKCGIAFSAPTTWVKEKSKRQQGIYCPNGHKRIYVWPEDETEAKKVELSEENASLKQRLFQLIHENEQLEARASEGKPAPDDPLPDDPPLVVAPELAPVRCLECPDCGKPYKNPGSLRGHLMHVHDYPHTKVDDAIEQDRLAAVAKKQ